MFRLMKMLYPKIKINEYVFRKIKKCLTQNTKSIV